MKVVVAIIVKKVRGKKLYYCSVKFSLGWNVFFPESIRPCPRCAPALQIAILTWTATSKGSSLALIALGVQMAGVAEQDCAGRKFGPKRVAPWQPWATSQLHPFGRAHHQQAEAASGPPPRGVWPGTLYIYLFSLYNLHVHCIACICYESNMLYAFTNSFILHCFFKQKIYMILYSSILKLAVNTDCYGSQRSAFFN